MISPHTERDDHHRKQMVWREWSDDSRGVAQELVEKPEGSVGDQIDMKELAASEAAAVQRENHEQKEKIECGLHERGRVARLTIGAGDGIPGIRAYAAQAATLQITADAPDGQTQRNGEREKIAR